MDVYKEISLKLKELKRVAFLTGAGISKESGIPTFREAGGLWTKFNPGELASMEGFQRDPVLVWRWYNDRRVNISDKRPNNGHIAMAEFEKLFEDVVVITQNIDGLHQRAGSSDVMELHGNIWEFKCMKEGTIIKNSDVPLKEIPPKCKCGAIYRPNVVWFGEMLPQDILHRAFDIVKSYDCLLVVGTSALVQPAASLPIIALQKDKLVIEINPEKTPISEFVHFSLQESASTALKKILKFLQSETS